MLSFPEAQTKLLELLPTPSQRMREEIELARAAGRVLAEDLVARFDFPRFDHSSMDGYAVRTADFEGDGPWALPVVGESRAGGTLPTFGAGTACRIFTGAELPRGADAVVMQEEVTREPRDGADVALFSTRPRVGHFVRRRGEDLRSGAVAIARGTRLRPAHVGLAAACDVANLVVVKKPRVTLVATGDELRAPGSPDRPGSIAESNGVSLAAVIEHAGGDATVAPFVKDDLDATARAFDAALAASDVVVSIGGVSVGDHDVVRPALERIGVTLDFYRVAIKPGKPLAVGRRGDRIVLGLPGNPVSAMITFALFGVPLLRAMAGESSPLPAPLRARIGHDVRRVAGRTEFARARLERRDGELFATLLSNQASGAVTSLVEADALAMIDADCTHLAEGASVDVFPLEGLGL